MSEAVKPSYLLIIRAASSVPNPNALLGFSLVGLPDDLKAWIEQKGTTPWPVYQQMKPYRSVFKSNTYYCVPVLGRPDFYCLHEFDTEEVKDFYDRWPDWFVDAVPAIPEERAVEWWNELGILEEDES